MLLRLYRFIVATQPAGNPPRPQKTRRFKGGSGFGSAEEGQGSGRAAKGPRNAEGPRRGKLSFAGPGNQVVGHQQRAFHGLRQGARGIETPRHTDRRNAIDFVGVLQLGGLADFGRD